MPTYAKFQPNPSIGLSKAWEISQSASQSVSCQYRISRWFLILGGYLLNIRCTQYTITIDMNTFYTQVVKNKILWSFFLLYKSPLPKLRPYWLILLSIDFSTKFCCTSTYFPFEGQTMFLKAWQVNTISVERLVQLYLVEKKNRFVLYVPNPNDIN